MEANVPSPEAARPDVAPAKGRRPFVRPLLEDIGPCTALTLQTTVIITPLDVF